MSKWIAVGLAIGSYSASAAEMTIRITYADKEFKDFDATGIVELPVKTKGWKCQFFQMPAAFRPADSPAGLISGTISCWKTGDKIHIAETVMCFPPDPNQSDRLFASLQQREIMFEEMTPKMMGSGTHITVTCKF